MVKFLDAQEGLFSWFPFAYQTFLEVGRYLELHEILEEVREWMPTPTFIKLTLPQNRADDLLQLLWRERVSPAHMMPTFGHVFQSLIVQSQWYNRTQ